MGVVLAPETEYAKEMRKWNAHHSEFGPPGRPYVYADYPAMMYKAERDSSKIGGLRFVGHVVNDEQERRNMESRGYVFGGPEKAQEQWEREQRAHGELAANREYHIQHGKHSEAAVKEIRAAEEAAGAVHLPDVPEKPRRGRPKKVTLTDAA